jgi:hypothetical protein
MILNNVIRLNCLFIQLGVNKFSEKRSDILCVYDSV